MVKPQERRDYLQSLERGLSVILAFSNHRPHLSLGDLAEATGLSRPTVRRIVLTLEELGYIHSEGRQFSLTPHVLALGNAYLSSLNITEVAQPFMEEVTRITGQTCSLAALDGDHAMTLARVPTRRVLSITLTTGSRLPAYATSMGRVLLAGLPDTELDSFLENAELDPLTPRTTTDPDQLRTIIAEVRQQGWALVDQELEEGVRSFSAPIRDFTGRVLASLSMSCATVQVSLETIREEHLPALIKTARDISERLGAHIGRDDEAG
ncbi:IclR family transcriptional regulator [Halopolyspora algeriensis]|uniref:IclR family transcriptional regulator n=1 Tax=Halopolyspora algeriensis TaxID=1500506 RepID=A0A368VY32_9ACTN|nr:IclR family transcriptional regulator C-terminal domain-containing protein [Halopolyspora algeriensis]RCW45752.1 IclR family transcriptional regulator [Halopolyspora algeriensis]TQM54136.1 IclR family transcriptional regulator [Halopolyspora algeriensis]